VLWFCFVCLCLVSCVPKCFQFLWIFHSWLLYWFSLTFISRKHVKFTNRIRMRIKYTNIKVVNHMHIDVFDFWSGDQFPLILSVSISIICVRRTSNIVCKKVVSWWSDVSLLWPITEEGSSGYGQEISSNEIYDWTLKNQYWNIPSHVCLGKYIIGYLFFFYNFSIYRVKIVQ
jgi:hypothetical protein